MQCIGNRRCGGAAGARPAAGLGAVRARQRSHQIQFLALLVGVDRCSLVMIDQLVERVELALPDAVHVALDVHAEVLVAAGRLQADGIVAHLWNATTTKGLVRTNHPSTLVQLCTHIRLAVAYQKVTVVAVRVQHGVALVARYRPIIPRFAGQVGPLRRRQVGASVAAAVGRVAAGPVHRRRRRQRVVAPVHRVVVADARTVGGIAATAAARRAAAERRGQVFGQLLQIVARHQTDLAGLAAGLVPGRF